MLFRGSLQLSAHRLLNIPIRSCATFAELLRNSSYIEMGDPKGKQVKGRVFKVVDDDLYIDFGHKFHCVCSKPQWYRKKVFPGNEVLLKINDLEMSKMFYGEWKAATLLEADCDLLAIEEIQDTQLESTDRNTNIRNSNTQADDILRGI